MHERFAFVVVIEIEPQVAVPVLHGTPQGRKSSCGAVSRVGLFPDLQCGLPADHPAQGYWGRCQSATWSELLAVIASNGAAQIASLLRQSGLAQACEGDRQ